MTWRNPLTLLSDQILDGRCCLFDTLGVGHVHVNGRQSVGGRLLQLVLSFLSVAACDDAEAQLVQVPREEITKPSVTASDVDIFISLVGHSFALLVPAIEEPDGYRSKDVQEHFSEAKNKVYIIIIIIIIITTTTTTVTENEK